MKNIVKIFVLSIFALAIASSYALSDDSPMGRCEKMCNHDKVWSKMDLDGMFFKKVHFILANADEIGLGDDQVDKLKALKHSVKKNLIKYDADIEVFALDIKEELHKDQVDTNTVDSLIDKKYAVKTQKAKELVGAYADVKKTLTKDQYKKLKDVWSESKTDMQKHEMTEEKEEHMMHKK